MLQRIVLALLLITSSAQASSPWAEKASEAMYRQLELDKRLQELTDRYIPKQLQLKVGDVSLVVNVLLQKRIEWKTTFP